MKRHNQKRGISWGRCRYHGSHCWKYRRSLLEGRSLFPCKGLSTPGYIFGPFLDKGLMHITWHYPLDEMIGFSMENSWCHCLYGSNCFMAQPYGKGNKGDHLESCQIIRGLSAIYDHKLNDCRVVVLTLIYKKESVVDAIPPSFSANCHRRIALNWWRFLYP